MSAPLFDPTAPVGCQVKIAAWPPRLADRLGRGHGMTVARMVCKRSPSHEVDEATLAALRAQSDFVVSGIGD